MTADAFIQLIVLYGWFLLVGLLVFLTLLARFYQRFAGERMYFQLYLIPMLLFGVQAVRQTNFAHDALGNLLAALGGLMLISLSVYLYRHMTSKRG